MNPNPHYSKYTSSPTKQFKALLDQILQSYRHILGIESSCGTAEALTMELRSILGAYEQMQNVYSQLLNESSCDNDLLNVIRNTMRDPFLTTLKMQMSLLSLEDVASNPVLIKDQANLTIKTMNQDSTISKLEELSNSDSTSKTHV
ncbi:MAG: hypothetical protein ACREA3_01470 [Nitrosotalea sp.]